jgi:hypothetical protein
MGRSVWVVGGKIALYLRLGFLSKRIRALLTNFGAPLLPAQRARTPAGQPPGRRRYCIGQ